jgi:hypothetical protein
VAVVTEPPYHNLNSGVAARNGTTNHVITFGFTPASGSLLVFLCFGPVTHTEDTGNWTERLQPVSSAELSVFTKTSAGETSISITHNGSNYQVAWVAYEFPAGSTWTGGIGASPTTDTFSQLTGLPGTEQVVFGARGRTSASATAATTTAWPGGWVEDADLYSPPAANEGLTFTVGRQNNVTATSVTPSATTTYGGTWDTADRQHVTFAIDAAVTVDSAAPSVPTGLTTTTVGSTTAALSWDASTDNVGVTQYEVIVVGP